MTLILWLFFLAFLATDLSWKVLADLAQKYSQEDTELMALDSTYDENDDETELSNQNNLPSILKSLSRRDIIDDVNQPIYGVTDLLLVVTVDGYVHGVNSSDGQVKWSQKNLAAPLVKTSNPFNHPANEDPDLDFEFMDNPTANTDTQGERILIPELGGNSTLYFSDGEEDGLKQFPFSLKTLVDMSPFTFRGKSYIASKRSQFVALDPITGSIINNGGCPANLEQKQDRFDRDIPFQSMTTSLMVGVSDYEVQVYIQGGGPLLWSITIREYFSDWAADLSENTAVLDGNNIKPKPLKLDVNQFDTPVIHTFHILKEQYMTSNRRGSLVAKGVDFHKLLIPSMAKSSSGLGQAYIGHLGDSVYALTSGKFDYLSSSKFALKDDPTPPPQSMDLVLYDTTNLQLNSHSSLFPVKLDSPPPENSSKSLGEGLPDSDNWFRKWLWLMSLTLMTTCGVQHFTTHHPPQENNKRKSKRKFNKKPLDPNSVKTLPDGSTQINSITVSDQILGYGSHGTIVYKGKFQGREVAVKRMLKDLMAIAEHEVNTLEDSDHHPNVIRYFCMERCNQFTYLCLELCQSPLSTLIESPNQLTFKCEILPSEILYHIINGIHHLHQLKIVHRDIKPQNILVNCTKDRFNKYSKPRILISDFGLCKRLEEDQSSFHATIVSGVAHGTMGWRAPELLKGLYYEKSTNKEISEATHLTDTSSSTELNINSCNSNQEISDTTLQQVLKEAHRITRSVDIFSVGCVFYYVLTNGYHPFGDRFQREHRVISGQSDLEKLIQDPTISNRFEAVHLIDSMIQNDPKSRPNTHQIINHPYFWNSEKRLLFLGDLSDYLEQENRNTNIEPDESTLLFKLQIHQDDIISTNWLNLMHAKVLTDLHRYRGYDGTRLRDLLRVIRNKKHHYNELPNYVKRAYGDMPEGFLNYFEQRFPKLLVYCFDLVTNQFINTSSTFDQYFR